MSSRLCPKIIIEGARLTLKTEIAFALNEHPRVVGERKTRHRSPIISAEWSSFTNVPWGRGLINFAPEEEARALETFRTWVRLFELQRDYPWIIDRFHLSTRVYQMIHQGRNFDFTWLEERLLPLGFRVILCTRNNESMTEAREQRVKVSGHPSRYGNLRRFAEEQQLFRSVVGQTKLPWMEVDVSDNSVSRAADKIAGWIPLTGGIPDTGRQTISP